MKRYKCCPVDGIYVVMSKKSDYVPAEVAQSLYDALLQTRSIVCDGCEEGFNPLAGDWAERLFYNNAIITKALSLADGDNND